MAVDLSVFGNTKTKVDYDREAALFNLKKRAAQGNDPAAIQLADAIGRARAAGDTQRLNDLFIGAKLWEKGVGVNEYGAPQEIPGYGDAVGQIAGTKKAYEQNAKNASDLGYAGSIEAAKKTGAVAGERVSELDQRKATFPQLQQTAKELSELGEDATFTLAGRGYDYLQRELRGKETPGAVARTQYTSLVDNQILPLLRETFGAQFTQKEGDSLKVTLGDPNKTPAEKNAVLESFINQKAATINSLERQLGQPVTNFGTFKVPGREDPLQASQNAVNQRNQEMNGGNPYGTVPQQPMNIDLYKRDEIRFNLRKQGYTPEEIDEYMQARGF